VSNRDKSTSLLLKGVGLIKYYITRDDTGLSVEVAKLIIKCQLIKEG